MFGLKIKEKFAALTTNLTGNTTKIDNNRHDLKRVMNLVEALQESNTELIEKVAFLESRQESLRGGLRAGLSEPSIPMLSDFEQLSHEHIDD